MNTQEQVAPPLASTLLPLYTVSVPVQAEVTLPGSKSITNRALLLAALADGTSRLRAPLHSEDTFYMTQALRELGVRVTETPERDFLVEGRGGAFDAPAKTLFIGNSGTTVRFLTAAACLAPHGADVILDGVARMRERPIRDLLGALLSLGVDCESLNGHGCPPVRVRGAGGLPGGACRLRGDVSSQFLSALLQITPYAQQDVEISIVGDLISKPYVDITQSVMAAFGTEFANDNYTHLTVRAGQRYQAQDYAIEADASNASYFLAAAAVTGGTVTLANLGSHSIQGDARFVDVLERMGCRIERGSMLSVAGPLRLRAVEANMEAIPDTAQTLAVLCAFADGPSRITGLASLRVKETDRVLAITQELRKLGVGVEEGPDFWVIHPPAGGKYTGAGIDTYEDHRMAMAFAVAGLRIPGIVIHDPGCVAKTFPDFWQRWEAAFPHG
jgi:3-phosphoshikimate 1-carboxyvinyltransferase